MHYIDSLYASCEQGKVEVAVCGHRLSSIGKNEKLREQLLNSLLSHLVKTSSVCSVSFYS